MAAFVQIGAVLLLLSWCFRIVGPFVDVVVWALVISVAIFPLHLTISKMLGGRAKGSAVLIALVGLAVLLVPSFMIGSSTVDFLKTTGESMKNGTFEVPPPTDKVKELPLIGEKAYDAWSAFSVDVRAAVTQFRPQVEKAGQMMLGMVTQGALTVLQFAISGLIAVAFLLYAESGYKSCCRVARGIAGERGKELVDLSVATVRSVAKGVLGVAVIQTVMALIIMLIWGIPGAGIWAVLVLAVAIVQLPPILVLGPVAAYVFSSAEPLSATIFLVLAIVVSFADTFLKPMLLGRGLEIPMLVILLGAIGGAIMLGIIGLFVGAVVLGVGFELFKAWIEEGETLP